VVVEPVAAFGAEVGIAGPVEVGAVVEQQQRCPVGRRGFAQAGRRQQAAEPVRAGDFRGAGKGLQQRRIGRHQHAHVVAERAQRGRQRTGDIAEAAGLDPGRELRRGEKDLHSVKNL
jgi:hypothetical protein